MYKKRIIALLMILCMFVSSAAAYTNYSIVFLKDPIDATTRWNSPIKSGSSYYYPTINSKWDEVRTTGTSPHVGIDLLVGTAYKVVAVVSGTLTKDTTDSNYNNLSLSTSISGVYCHYEHMSTYYANGYYSAGDQIGIPGSYGADGVHLHFGAYNTQNITTRLSYRNETLYRNASTWDYGRHCDVFSQVQWLNNRSAQLTVSFSGSNNLHTEKPSEVRMYYRLPGNSTWIDAGTMTNSSGYNYTYNFSSLVSSGTTIQWMARITRNISITKKYMFVPTKYYNPDANPNSTGNAYQYYTNTVTY